MQVDGREQVLNGRRHVHGVAGQNERASMTEVLLVNALDLSDDGGLVEVGTEPSQMKDRLEVGPLDEGQGLLGRSAVRGVPRLGQLAAEAIHLRP